MALQAATTRRASCSCGQLVIDVEGEPIRISVCHCLDCQRRTGSVFSAQARWPREHVRVRGPSTEWVRVSEAGHRSAFYFCSVCSATVYYTIEAMPDVIAVPIGAFADPAFPTPSVSVYEERKHAWVTITGDLDHQH